jgi:hypothetical protein
MTIEVKLNKDESTLVLTITAPEEKLLATIEAATRAIADNSVDLDKVSDQDKYDTLEAFLWNQVVELASSQRRREAYNAAYRQAAVEIDSTYVAKLPETAIMQKPATVDVEPVDTLQP